MRSLAAALAALTLACTTTPAPEALPDAAVAAADDFDDGRPVSCDPSCPDGAFCSTRDLCASAGPIACVQPCPAGQSCGPFAPGCRPNGCTPGPWPVPVQKAVALRVALADEGCDLDGDGDVDNALGAVARVVPGMQDRLRETVETAQSVVMLRQEGTDLQVWFGALAAASSRCNPASTDAFCAYTVSPWSFDLSGERATCGGWWRMPNASSRDGLLAAGGGDATEAFVPFTSTALLVRLARARLLARAITDANGERYGDGVLCAALVPAQLRLALGALPESVLAGVGGLEKAQWLFDTLVHPDLDLDQDGRLDHVSVALLFETTQALAVGLSP